MKKLFVFSSFIFTITISSAQFNPLLYSTNILGQRNNPIVTSVPFLLITPDARASALEETGSATSPDNYSIYWNAAKLAFINNDAGFALSITPWLRVVVPDINLSYFSTYIKKLILIKL